MDGNLGFFPIWDRSAVLRRGEAWGEVSPRSKIWTKQVLYMDNWFGLVVRYCTREYRSSGIVWHAPSGWFRNLIIAKNETPYTSPSPGFSRD
jgi:hypothetical protein